MQNYSNHIYAGKLDQIKSVIILLVLVSAAFVLREPAPYDVLILILIGITLLTGLWIPRGLSIPATLLMVFFLFDLVGVLSAFDINKSRTHVAVTIYLGITSLFFSCLIARNTEKMLRIIFNGYTIGAVITALAGIAGYFWGIEIFTENGRARGMFKDPNVFGPYLILPALYTMYMLINTPLRRAWPWLGIFGIFLVAILLSFSRAAWGHFILSAILFILLSFFLTADTKKKGRILSYVGFVSILSIGLLMVLVSIESVNGLFTERLSFTQSYDVAERGGRFEGHLVALQTVFINPFGVGPLSFTKIYGADPHNVYLQTALSAGWVGGLAYLLLVLITLWRGLLFLYRRTPVQEFFIICYATFLPLTIEGLIIDTDHWRHFYLLLGLIWGMMAIYKRKSLVIEQKSYI